MKRCALFHDLLGAIVNRATGALIVLAACHGGTSVARPSSPAVIDAATAATCKVTYECSMSHPGMGSFSDTTSVDLASCTKVAASESGPYEATQLPPMPGDAASDSLKRTRTESKLAPAACASIAKLVASLRRDDLKGEPAQIDTAACALVVACPPDPSKPAIDVQRQTTTGDDPVAKVIREIRAAQ